MLKSFGLLFILIIPAFSIIVTDPPTPEDYVYSYDVEDPNTGDTKSQHEVRKGDYVKGAYSVIGPDGTKRIVEYTADPKHGFKAILREEPLVVSTPKPVKKFYAYAVPLERIIPYPLTPHLRKIVKISVPKPSFRERDSTVYFTPHNELQVEKISFQRENYFEPENKHL